MSLGYPDYCYWSLATGESEVKAMTRCLETAREAGVHRTFHVLSDRGIDGCECYDAMDVERNDGLEKMVCLKAAMSRLTFEYFVWVEPRTVFRREPVDLCSLLRRSPLHVPLSLTWPGRDLGLEASKDEICAAEFMSASGVLGRPYFGYSQFWIIHRDAIDLVSNTVVDFWRRGKDQGLRGGIDLALAFAMQLFCADRREHLWERHPEYWCPRRDHVERTSDHIDRAAIVDPVEDDDLRIT